MTLALHARGLFTWTEWAATLAEEIRRAQGAGDPDDGSTYYRHWLAAIERLAADKGLTSAASLDGAPRRLGPCRARNAAWRADPAGERPAAFTAPACRSGRAGAVA